MFQTQGYNIKRNGDGIKSCAPPKVFRCKELEKSMVISAFLEDIHAIGTNERSNNDENYGQYINHGAPLIVCESWPTLICSRKLK